MFAAREGRNTINLETIGKKIKELRLRKKLTQQQVAERMGITQSQVARIEKRGYDAYTLRTLRRYIEALGGEFSLEVAVKKDNETVEFQNPAIA